MFRNISEHNSVLHNAILKAVKRDNKQRFSLLEENGELLIRANQGHTITVIYPLDTDRLKLKI